ncbi:MAG: 2Fe-2S iron-sulfur cluster-binding protein [Bradyrhizobium sp.]|uniref:2Fe-2S iron-sulfur cluster-binding protein n=1 Tax=Bradyrhizobium sp. TaxID=376 RepID=UPI000B5695FA|nr:2Fe-2S iron-sulfur cluster-binding protein [Bradyrhizobium sp.]ART39429.1 J501 [uncultured bacterium]MDX3969229.1 2Fe-2S iron-sulfur cluster-binding protein [Bradyrhizobium sp.]
MPKVTYIEYFGTEHNIDVPEGFSVMQGAMKNGVPGILAECMGACACATCHVYIDANWVSVLEPPSSTETAMLEYAECTQRNSRLSCQIKVTKELDGLVVRLPKRQQ